MSNIIGIQSGKVVLSSSNFSRTAIGLEFINDVYSCKTSDLDTIMGTIKNGASHFAITALMQELPSDRHNKMLAESVSFENMAGGVTKIAVNYVGLYRDTKPKPVISGQPLDLNQYLHFPLQYTISFVEEIGATSSLKEVDFVTKYKQKSIVLKINDYDIPTSPIAAYLKRFDIAQEFFTNAGVEFNTAWLAGVLPYFIISEVTESNEPIERTTYKDLYYYGLRVSGFSYARRGLFAEATITISDSAVLTDPIGGNSVFLN